VCGDVDVVVVIVGVDDVDGVVIFVGGVVVIVVDGVLGIVIVAVIVVVDCNGAGVVVMCYGCCWCRCW